MELEDMAMPFYFENAHHLPKESIMRVFSFVIVILAVLPLHIYSRDVILTKTQEISIDMGSTAVWFRADATLSTTTGTKTFYFSNNTSPEVVNRALSLLLVTNSAGRRLQITVADGCNDNCPVTKVAVLD
jgi:hypothetical protein